MGRKMGKPHPRAILMQHEPIHPDPKPEIKPNNPKIYLTQSDLTIFSKIVFNILL